MKPTNQKEQWSVHWITQYAPATAILHSKAFREVTFKGLVPLLGHTIVTLENSAHYQRRSIEGRLFALSVLQNYEQTLIPTLIEEVLAPVLAAKKGCLVEIAHAVASRIAARVIGLDGLDNSARLSEVTFYISALVGGTSVSAPDGANVLTRREARNRLWERFIYSAIDRRRNLLQQYQAGRLAKEALPFDLITLLLQHSVSENESGQAVNLEMRAIAAEVAFYAVAAVDTTASLVPRLLHELWKFADQNPQHLNLLSELDFLRDAAAETLRLHPVVPTIFRQAIQKTEISGYTFEQGQSAGLFLPSINTDSMVFGPDAAEFNPLRMLPPKLRRAGFSFGGGTHLCLGRELALGAPQFGAPNQPANQLFGEAALLAHALLAHHARPDPANPVTEPSPYERDIFKHYPILLN